VPVEHARLGQVVVRETGGYRFHQVADRRRVSLGELGLVIAPLRQPVMAAGAVLRR